MLLAMRKVTAPDRTSWAVSVDWTRRPVKLPRVHRGRRRSRRDRAADGVDALSAMPDFGDDLVVGLVAFVAFIAVGLLLVVVVWPLLALAAELAIVVLLVLAGTIGRVCFGRPWVIEAVSDSGVEHRWQVRGMAAARRTIDQIADHLAAGLEPQPSEAEPVSA